MRFFSPQLAERTVLVKVSGSTNFDKISQVLSKWKTF
ncbi:unnamed protein product [Tenebrio molitor]|nr:unnamed protein product [Tenebrio molitor]